MTSYASPGRRRLLALSAPLFAAACGSSTEPSLYTLTIKSGPVLQGGPPVVQLREIGLARYLDRREIVRSSDGNRLDVAYNEWWGEPLGAMIARVLVVGLQQRLPNSSIYNENGAIASDPNAILAVNIQRLDVDQSGTLQLLAQAAVEFNRPRKSAARTFTIAKPVPAPTIAGHVAAASDAVGDLTDGIAALLQR